MAEDSCSPPHHFLSSSLLEEPLYIFFHPHGYRERYLQLHDLPQTVSMGSKRVGLFIILFVQLFVVNHAASYTRKPLPKTDYFPENVSKNEMEIKQNRKIDHRLGRASDNAGKGGNDGGGGSRSLQGKANFIPIYAAGAARRRSRQRSSASCLRSSDDGLSSVVGAATLASLLHFYMIF